MSVAHCNSRSSSARYELSSKLVSLRGAGVQCFPAPKWNNAGISLFKTKLQRHVKANAPLTRGSSSLTKWEEEEVNEKELEQLRNHICDLLEDGDDVTARAIIDANYELLMDQLDAGTRGISQAALLDVLAQANMDIADLKGAERLLEQLEDVMKLHSAPKNYADKIFEHMGMMYSALQKPRHALKFYTTCLELQEQLFGPNDARICRALLGCADMQGILDNKDESISTYRRLVNILENSKDEELLALPLSRIGGALLEQRKLPESEVFLNRALRIVRKRSDKERDENAVQILSMLARVKRFGDDLEASVALYDEALKLMERGIESDHNNHILELIRTDYATALTMMKRHAKAQELLEANLLTKQTAVGPSDPSLIVHLKNLAASYGNGGNLDKCEAVLRRYLTLATAHFGPIAPQLMEPLQLLANLLHRRGKQLDEAESFARQLLRISEKTHGEEHPFTGEVCNCLAAILYSLNSFRESEVIMWRILRIQESWMGADNIGLIPTLERLVKLNEKLGKETTALLSRLEDLKSQEST